MSEKRNDLQGIRGISILLVLFFHLKPKLFPHGFIGVDIFFVLSGYLMTMILSKQLINSNVSFDIYSRRFKRIVPLFASILTAVYLVGWFYLMEVDRNQLLTDLTWSMSFTSNIQPLFEIKGYWDQVLSYRFLVHCWSLGVEIQFYIIAPLIVGYFRQQKWNHLIYILLVCSFIFQLKSEPKIAYGMLPSRVWQFLCGTIAFDIEEKFSTKGEYQLVADDEITLLDEENSDKSEKRSHGSMTFTILREFLPISLIALVILNPPMVGETEMRFLGTLLTTAFICSSNIAVFSFVSIKPLVYIGDISYTLYLVHWPTLVFYKYYYSLIDLNYSDIIWCLSTMFILTIVIHHTLEQFLIRSRLLIAFVIFAGCILFILITSPFYKQMQLGLLVNHNNEQIIANAIRINAEEDKRGSIEKTAVLKNPKLNYFWIPCHRDYEAEKWTKWKSEPQLRCVTQGNGSLNVLVLGNSIAYRAFPTIHSLFKGRFNTMRLHATSGIPAIYSSKSRHAATFEASVRPLLEHFKPDLLFVIYTIVKSYLKEGEEMQAPVKDWKTDKVVQHMQKNFDFYSNYTRKIVIDLPYYYNVSVRPAQEINKRLTFGKSLDDLKVTRKQVYDQQHWQHERLRHLNCTKCIYNDIGESLFDGDTLYLYDRKTFLAIISDGAHFSQAGLRRVRKQYEAVVEKVIAELEMTENTTVGNRTI